MAGPLAQISVEQVAQSLSEQQAKQPALNKSGPSKFDHSLKIAGPEGVDPTSNVQRVADVQAAPKAERLHKTGQSDTPKNGLTGRALEPVTQKSAVHKSTSMVMSLVANLEKGQVQIDRLINGGLSGKSMSNQQLLSLQAGMYKYAQELDLCSKVVEKATNGLKDTLKTQV